MAIASSMFCAHKRLRTACLDCRPELAARSALDDDIDTIRRPRRPRA